MCVCVFFFFSLILRNVFLKIFLDVHEIGMHDTDVADCASGAESADSNAVSYDLMIVFWSTKVSQKFCHILVYVSLQCTYHVIKQVSAVEGTPYG